jgi:hypothetical protein
MALFGIITSEFGSSDEYYVCDDEEILEWILDNNYGTLDEDEQYPVPAPEGYIFRCSSVFRKDAKEIEGLDESELTDTEFVSYGSAENDKVLMLIEGILKPVARKEFFALELPDDRILEYMIY